MFLSRPALRIPHAIPKCEAGRLFGLDPGRLEDEHPKLLDPGTPGMESNTRIAPMRLQGVSNSERRADIGRHGFNLVAKRGGEVKALRGRAGVGESLQG